MKTLIAYATRFGATGGTAEEIAKNFREEGFDVTVADLKKEKIQSISDYDLIVLGSGMSMGNWDSEAEDFVKRFHENLENKKLAIFISSLKPVEEKDGKLKAVERIQKVGLTDKVSKYSLNPIPTGAFGGVVDYNQLGFMMRKAMEVGYKSKLQKYAFKETAPGVYDLHDWDEIRSWSRVLAQKAQVKKDDSNP